MHLVKTSIMACVCEWRFRRVKIRNAGTDLPKARLSDLSGRIIGAIRCSERRRVDWELTLATECILCGADSFWEKISLWEVASLFFLCMRVGCYWESLDARFDQQFLFYR